MNLCRPIRNIDELSIYLSAEYHSTKSKIRRAMQKEWSAYAFIPGLSLEANEAMVYTTNNHYLIGNVQFEKEGSRNFELTNRTQNGIERRIIKSIDIDEVDGNTEVLVIRAENIIETLPLSTFLRCYVMGDGKRFQSAGQLVYPTVIKPSEAYTYACSGRALIAGNINENIVMPTVDGILPLKKNCVVVEMQCGTKILSYAEFNNYYNLSVGGWAGNQIIEVLNCEEFKPKVLVDSLTEHIKYHESVKRIQIINVSTKNGKLYAEYVELGTSTELKRSSIDQLKLLKELNKIIITNAEMLEGETKYKIDNTDVKIPVTSDLYIAADEALDEIMSDIMKTVAKAFCAVKGEFIFRLKGFSPESNGFVIKILGGNDYTLLIKYKLLINRTGCILSKEGAKETYTFDIIYGIGKCLDVYGSEVMMPKCWFRAGAMSGTNAPTIATTVQAFMNDNINTIHPNGKQQFDTKAVSKAIKNWYKVNKDAVNMEFAARILYDSYRYADGNSKSLADISPANYGEALTDVYNRINNIVNKDDKIGKAVTSLIRVSGFGSVIGIVSYMFSTMGVRAVSAATGSWAAGTAYQMYSDIENLMQFVESGSSKLQSGSDWLNMMYQLTDHYGGPANLPSSVDELDEAAKAIVDAYTNYSIPSSTQIVTGIDTGNGIVIGSNGTVMVNTGGVVMGADGSSGIMISGGGQAGDASFSLVNNPGGTGTRNSHYNDLGQRFKTFLTMSEDERAKACAELPDYSSTMRKKGIIVVIVIGVILLAFLIYILKDPVSNIIDDIEFNLKYKMKQSKEGKDNS